MAKSKKKSASEENIKSLIETMEPVQKEEQGPDFVERKDGLVLSSDHLLQLEVTQRDVENYKLLMALEEQALRNMDLTMEILKSRIEKQKLVVQSKANQYESEKIKYSKLRESIFKIYNIPGDKFGYDRSGKILID